MPTVAKLPIEMGNISRCNRGCLFTILTLLAIGASAVLLILIVYYFVQLKIHELEKTIFAIVVTAMCVSIVLLAYAF
jgi:hypothetical protein